MRFDIRLSQQAISHLKYFSARQQAIILDGIEAHLSFEPSVKTKHRKLMRPNPLASWELRIGGFRVYYDVHEHPVATVEVLAVGVKRRNIIMIGGEEISL
jgi:mRNA-degrading endonuclease RelE of RelBE toxin-antitoxin system